MFFRADAPLKFFKKCGGSDIKSECDIKSEGDIASECDIKSEGDIVSECDIKSGSRPLPYTLNPKA